jgi:hypothetical protein
MGEQVTPFNPSSWKDIKMKKMRFVDVTTEIKNFDDVVHIVRAFKEKHIEISLLDAMKAWDQLSTEMRITWAPLPVHEKTPTKIHYAGITHLLMKMFEVYETPKTNTSPPPPHTYDL